MDWNSLDRADIFRRPVLFAFRRRQLRGAPGSWADAEDLAAEAIRRLLDSDYPEWDPNREPDLLRHLGSTINGLIANESRAVRFRIENSLSDPSIFRSAERMASSAENFDEIDGLKRALSLPEARVADDELTRRVLSLEGQGITRAAKQSTELDVAIDIVYAARRRLAGHREAVRREMATGDSPGAARDHLRNEGRSWR